MSDILISSLQNERVKGVVKLRRRADRDILRLYIIEGYRALKRALDNHQQLITLYYCEDFFSKKAECDLITRCHSLGVECCRCTTAVFQKMAYGDRPDGLLATARQIHLTLADLTLGTSPLLLVAEAIEKPGNLGSLLRSADAAGADAVLVCDERTDLHNPNVVRASIGTLFSMPVVATSASAALFWLQNQGIKIMAATPHAPQLYTEMDMRPGLAIVVGTEHDGLGTAWMEKADCQARIPMHGQVDSLNVATAATILLFEAVRQRGQASVSHNA